MAEDSAIGFSIEIPDSVFKKLDDADAKLKRIQDTVKKTSSVVVSNFKSMASGVNPFITKLNETNKMLSKMSLNSFSKNIGSSLSSVERFTNAVNSLSNALSKANSTSRINIGGTTTNTNDIQKLNHAITDLISKYSKLSTEFENYKRKRISTTTSEKEAATAMAAYNRAMASSEGTIAQRINKMAKLRNAEEQLLKTGKNYTTELNNIRAEMQRLVKENDKYASSVSRVSSSHSKVLNTADQLTRKLALLFSVSQIQGYLDNLVRVRGEFELQNKSLQVILQNKEQADRLFEQITELAVKSPFQLKELVTYTKQLAAYRIESTKLYDTTKMLADISAGLGVSMDRLILAYGQVKAANYLRGSELRQFSEAGVNILGELADYFTQLEGHVVSVGEVFERVTKRMVTFQDVDTIFKKMTSEGGIFFQMQEQQADTLAGQISNLRDSLDIMFNEIGQANEGVIKGIVAAVRSVVENWEALAVVLKSVTTVMALYTAKTVLATLATKSLAASGNEAAVRLMRMKSLSSIGGVFSKITAGLSALGKSLKSNPFVLIATAVSAAGYALYEYNKKVEEARSSYDTLTNVINRNENQLKSLVDKYKQTSAAVSSLEGEVSRLKKGSSEYEQAQKQLTDAQIENSNVLNKLKKDFPEVYDEMHKNKGGVEGLTKAQEAYNAELAKTRALNILMQSGATWFDEDIKKDLSDLLEANQSYNKSVNDLKGSYEAIIIEAQKASKSSDAMSKAYGDAVLKISEGAGTIEEKMSKIVKSLSYASVSGGAGLKIFNMTSEALLNLSDSEKEYTKATKEAQKEVQRLIDNIVAQSGVATEEQFRDLDDAAKNSAKKFVLPFLEEIPTIKEKFIQDFVNEEFRLKLGFDFDFSNDIVPELTGIQKKIDEYIDDNKLEIGTIKYDQSFSDYFESLRKEIKSLREEEEKLKKATEQRQDSQTNKERLEEVQNQARDIEKILRDFGEYDYSTDKKEAKSANKVWEDRISLIEQAGKEYEKFIQYYSAEDAATKVRDNFEQAFNNLQIGDILATMTFDTSGVISALEDIGEKGGTEISKKVDEKVSKLKTDIDIDVKVKNISEIKKQVDNLFSGYDFFKELRSLDLSKEIGSQIFNIAALDLDDLQVALAKYKESLGSLGTEQVKIFEEAEKKVTELQNREREERLKKYVQYLNKSVSKRVSIELEAQKEIAKIQSDQYLTSDQKSTIVSNMRKDLEKQLNSLSWDQFKGNDMYISMFEDLERTSTTAIEVMLDKLRQLRNSLGDLSPTELKDITSQIQKLQDELESRNPFRDLIPNIREYISYLKEKNNLEKAYTDSVERESDLETRIEIGSKEVASLQQQYDLAVKKYGVDSRQADMAETRLLVAKKNLTAANDEYETQKKTTKEIIDQIKEGETLRDVLAGAFSVAGSYASDLSGTISSVASSLENVFGTMSDKTSDTINTITEVLNGLSDIGSGVSSIMSGNIVSGTLQTIRGLASTIGSLFNIGDKKKEREIQRQIELVENLDKSCQKLAESIENAYSFDSLTQSNEAAQQNLQQQIDAYERMIALEEDKKKTDSDKIKEWQDAISDLQEQQQQLEQDMITAVGGIGDESDIKSAAEDFVDAWLTAYTEVGDGLSGLQDNFDEFIQNAAKKQLLAQLSDQFITPILESFNKMFGADSLGGENLTGEELDAFRKLYEEYSEMFDERAKAYLEALGIEPGTDGTTEELSGLSKGIQSITEETAQALEALLNSMRFFVADSNTQLKSIYASLTSQDALQNPILAEMKTQTALIQSINNLFGSVIKSGHPKYGGSFIKVSM